MSGRAEARDRHRLIVKRSQTEPIRFHGSARPIFIVIGAVVRHGAYWTALKNLHFRKRTKTFRWYPTCKKSLLQLQRQKLSCRRGFNNRYLNMFASSYTTPCLVSKKWCYVRFITCTRHGRPRSRASFKTCHHWELKWKQTRGFTHLKYSSDANLPAE